MTVGGSIIIAVRSTFEDRRTNYNKLRTNRYLKRIIINIIVIQVRFNNSFY